MRSFLIALSNEVGKGLRFAWAERIQTLIEMPLFALLILLLGPIFDQAGGLASGDTKWSLDSESTSVLIAWFIPFVFFYFQIIKVFWRLLGEMQSGTLEQVYLSPLPTWVVVAGGRVVATVLETLFVAGGIYGILQLFVPLSFQVTWALLLPALLIMVTAVGLSLVVAGAALVWKRVETIPDAAAMLCFIGSASAVPLMTLPAWWKSIGWFLPLNAGLENIFGVLFEGASGTALWGEGGLVWVVAIAAAYLTIGIVVFRLGERTAKRRSVLGRY